MGKRRKTDPQPGDSGRYEELTPEKKAKAFDRVLGRSVVRAADKKLKGKSPYEGEPTTKKKRFGRKS